MLNRLPAIFLSPFFISLIISGVVYFFVPKSNHEYHTIVTKDRTLPPYGFINYIDLDGDGLSERIIGTQYANVPVVEIFSNDGIYINNWPLTGRWACKFKLMYGDYDDNGFVELYVLTEENDSLFLHWLEPFKDNAWKPSKLNISDYKYHNNQCDYTFLPAGLSDLNHDGKKEVIFAISTGYGLSPRSVFAVDVFNGQLLQSPESYAALREPVFVVDLDDDGIDEIIIQTGATGNTKADSVIPYSDYSAWLMVFDHNLQFKFPPMEFPGEQKSIWTVPVVMNGSIQLFSLLIDKRSAAQPQRLFVHSGKGEFIREIDIGKIAFIDNALTLLLVRNRSDNLLFITDNKNGIVYKLNSDYLIKKIADFKERIEQITFDDYDNDGNPEIFFYKYKSKKICLADINFKIKSEESIDLETPYEDAFIGKIEKPGPAIILAQFGLEVFLIEYIPAPFYHRFKLIGLIYAGVFLIVVASQKLQSITLKQKQKVENRINELQLKSTLNQLDPHFAFNVINTISTNILNDNKEIANDYLVEFSRLLRRSLEYSDKISWSLESEIEFVRAYLKLQKSRFGELFDFRIDLDKTLDFSVHIPKMIVQGYIENAIKHGLRPKAAKGLLVIKVQQAAKYLLQIQIEDDGIGRAASQKLKSTSGTGKGMKLSTELVFLYNKLTGNNIEIQIDDLVDEANIPAGTSVSIYVPLK